MRFFSIITAIVVVGVLYLLVLERDTLMSFAGVGTSEAAQEVADDTAEQASEEPDNTTIRVVHVVVKPSVAQVIDSAVLLRGRTEAARQVIVQAEVSGLVRSEPLRKGAYVEEGQLLCEIDPGTRLAILTEAEARVPEAQARLPEAQGRLAEAEARLSEAEINDNAAKQLSEGGFASSTRVASTRAAVQAAKAGVQTAMAGVQSAKAGIQAVEAALSGAKKEIERLDVKSPFAGLLETDTAELGSLLQPGGHCATVIQLDPIKLIGFVPETEVDKVTVNSPAGARLASGKEVRGKVTFISRSADMETRTFRVEVQVPNKDLAIRDGQTAEILIASEGQSAHLVPASSLTLNNDGALGVRIAKDSKAAFVQVSILRDTVDGIWVAGLPEQADIIVVGQEYVTDGVAIKTTAEADVSQ
jgi:multidrug efflux system membrane fusion protein